MRIIGYEDKRIGELAFVYIRLPIARSICWIMPKR